MAVTVKKTNSQDSSGQFVARLRPGVRQKLKEIGLRDDRSMNYLLNYALLKWLHEEERWSPHDPA